MAEKDRPGARVATVHAVATAKFRLWVLESRECRELSRGSDYAGVVRRENRDGAAAVDGTSAGRFKKRLAFPPRLLRRRSCSLELPAYKMGPDIYETMSSSPLALAPFAVPALRETMSLSAVTTREALLFPAPGGSCSLLPGFHRLCLRACLVLAEPARAPYDRSRGRHRRARRTGQQLPLPFPLKEGFTTSRSLRAPAEPQLS